MFPLSLEGDLVIRRQNRWSLEVVNLHKKVEAACLIRPHLKRGDEIKAEDTQDIVLDPDSSEVMEVRPSGLMVIHWIVGDETFFETFRRRHIPRDGRMCVRLMYNDDMEVYLARSKARNFRLE